MAANALALGHEQKAKPQPGMCASEDVVFLRSRFGFTQRYVPVARSGPTQHAAQALRPDTRGQPYIELKIFGLAKELVVGLFPLHEHKTLPLLVQPGILPLFEKTTALQMVQAARARHGRDFATHDTKNTLHVLRPKAKLRVVSTQIRDAARSDNTGLGRDMQEMTSLLRHAPSALPANSSCFP